MVPTNVATNRKTLTENCQGFSIGVEKLSGVMSSSVAAASKPTTAGRKPLNTDCTRCVCMYFMKSLLMSYNIVGRLVTSYSASLLSSIDYKVVNPLLQKDIDDSKEFLKKVLMS